MIVHDPEPRDVNTKYADYEPDITLELRDTVRVDFPDGTTLYLHAGWETSGVLSGASLTVYEDPGSNPVLQYSRQVRS